MHRAVGDDVSNANALPDRSRAADAILCREALLQSVRAFQQLVAPSRFRAV
jgi:hypothetical protein